MPSDTVGKSEGFFLGKPSFVLQSSFDDNHFRMNDTRKFQILLLALAAALVSACVVFGVVIMQSWREYDAFEARQVQAEQELEALHAQNLAQEKYLTELLNNPDLIERAARENLNYSREGELIFKFDQ